MKSLKVIIASSLIALSLTACSSNMSQEILSATLTDKVDLTSMPYFDPTTVALFEGSKEWKVDTSTKEEGIPAELVSYFVTNADNTCRVQYQILFDVPLTEDADSTFLTKSYLYNVIQASDSTSLKKLHTKTVNLKTTKSVDVGMLEAEYASPNYASAVTGPDEKPEVKGTINSVSLIRVFDTMIKNPYAANNALMPQEANPILSIHYQCLDKNLDKNFWSKVISNAKVVLK